MRNSIFAKQQQKDRQKQAQQVGAPYPSKARTLVFFGFGFYFLIFGMVEFITNTHESFYSYQLTCDVNNNCSATTDNLRFQVGVNISMYLKVQGFNQNDVNIKNSFDPLNAPSSFDQGFSNCDGYFTNSDLNKNISVTGVSLDPFAKAIPCGLLPGTFPVSSLQLYDIKRNLKVPIFTDTISSPFQPLNQNINLNQQWQNMIDPRFNNWMNISPSGGLVKYWGVVMPDIIGKFTISLLINSSQIIKDKYWIIFEDNQALGGYNPPLCYGNFVASGISLLFGCLGYLSKKQQLKIAPQ